MSAFIIYDYSRWDKNIIIQGPGEDFFLSVDFDDVCPERVEAYMLNVVKILNENWTEPEYELEDVE